MLKNHRSINLALGKICNSRHFRFLAAARKRHLIKIEISTFVFWINFWVHIVWASNNQMAITNIWPRRTTDIQPTLERPTASDPTQFE